MNFLRFGAKPGLYLLASYPKSGNTGARLLLDAWATDAPVDINRIGAGVVTMSQPLFVAMTDAEAGDMTESELLAMRPAFARALARNLIEQNEARWYKCHEANLPPPGASSAPYPANVVASVALIVRDPRDVAISMAHHAGISIDEAIDRMGETMRIVRPRDRSSQSPHLLSSWSEFNKSWLDGPAPQPTILRYEDMLADPESCLGAVLGTMGLKPEPGALVRAAERCSFGVLAAQERQHGFIERPAFSSAAFFREGRANAWRTTLTDAQRAKIETDHGSVMRQFGYLDPSP